MWKNRLFLLFAIALSLLFAPHLQASIFDEAIDELRFLASDTQKLQQQIEEAGKKLRQTNFNEYLSQGYEKFSELLKSAETTDKEPGNLKKNRHALKVFLEALGRKKFGEDGKTFNEKASELITRIRPDLRDTDFAADPARSIYYFLALDPGGFVENVKLIRGPMGAPMTLREAYEYYYRTDPQKAARILILLETLQKIGAPTTDESQLEIILKAVKTNIELLNEEEPARPIE